MGKKRLIYLCLCVILVFSCVSARGDAEMTVWAVEDDDDSGSSSDDDTTTELIDTTELEEQKQDTIDKIEDIQDSLDSIADTIASLESSSASLSSAIAALDEEANELQAQIQEFAEEIEAKQAEIEEAEAELEATKAEAVERYEAMKKRIAYMYENSSTSYLELFLTSESMADFLNKSEYFSQITEYDHEMLIEYAELQAEIEEQTAELQAEEEELELMAETAEEQLETVEALIETKTAQIAAYQAEIAAQSVNAEDYEDDLEYQEALLEQIEAQIAAAAAANALASDGDGGASTGFIWPCPSSHTISSYYGPREQPVAGASTDHKGIDIAASYGAAIVASASGRVTTATYSSSAGNYVVISHGNGISTVYMHCSALYVSVGDTVEQGETIAAVGSTGYSTGNHLHFGVIVNGSYVNPLGYVS